MTTEEKIEDMKNFLKQAFRIDGDCKEKGFYKLSKDGKHTEALTFKLNDSKRGEFLVSLSFLK